jgi:hypothetical protein
VVDGCDRLNDHGSPYCHLHRERVRRTGEVGPAQPTRVRGRVKPTKEGYVRLYLPDGRRVQEHVYVMEQRLCRRLVPPENVHHRNGVKDDNDRFCPVCVDVEFPQELVMGMLQCASCGTRVKPNLELWLTMQPSGQRVEDLIAFVVEHYPAEVRQALGAAVLPNELVSPAGVA